ncbi:unnamed protein product [Paramecium pentaurelia]|uniref:Uncharacterized protein n=1 Tax=Paramecium pentaurelia TaxID=43138 RepID=A0A8S1V553_9CILI|nr:unnamed protein product [Paramecium pentaurelia]
MNNKKDQNLTAQGTQIKGAAKQPTHQVQQQKPAQSHPVQHQPANKQQQQQKPTTQHPTNTKTQTKQQPQQQQQAAKPQQQQQQQQQVQQVAPKKLEPKRTIKLQAMLGIMDQDKEEGKISFLIDKTGNAYTFFKYKGTIIDISSFVITEQNQGKNHEENVEKARKCVVYGLEAGDNLVFSTDITATNLNEFFKSDWYKPEAIFNYEEITNPKYFRAHLLKPEEDKDGFGNKGQFWPKKELHIVLLYTQKEGEFDFEQHLNKLGLDKLKNQFIVTIIED